MEEERIKSAFELAMERVSALPELTPEEIAAQNEKRFAPIGEAIANRYLDGFVDEDELLSETGKYRGEQGWIVRRALVSRLCRTLNFQTNPEQAEKAAAGLIRLTPGEKATIEKGVAEIQGVAREFEQERLKKAESFESLFLGPLGISGSAVRVNPVENAQWQEELLRLRKAYEPKLERVQAALSKIGDAPQSS